MSKKRVRRTKEQIAADNAKKEAKKTIGLGDAVEKVMECTGGKVIAHTLMGEDCGCEERKEYLNELGKKVLSKIRGIFGFRGEPIPLTVEEFEWLDDLYTSKRMQLKPTEQVKILAIYNRVMRQDKATSNCASCYLTVHRELKEVYNAYINQ